MYKDLAGFNTQITDTLSSTGRYLPISEADREYLLEQLDDGDHTYLQVRDGRAIEYIKVANMCGTLFIDKRGAEKTKPLAFRCNSSLSFALTMSGVRETVCQMENCDGE